MVAFESYFLGRLYKMASTEMKKSPIIASLEILFFSISCIFVTLAIVSFTNHLNNFWSDFLKSTLVIPAYFVYKNMSKFREMSLDKGMKNTK